jgi:nucleoside phosphorylase
LVISAWAPELAALDARLRTAPALSRTTSLRSVGVGLIEAAAGTASVLAKLPRAPRAVVLVGTAGLQSGSRSPFELGDAAVVRRAVLLSHAVLRKDAYFPRPLPVEIKSDRALAHALARSRPRPIALADVACPLGITATKSAARLALSGTGCTLENLDTFAAARACAAAGIPFAAVLGIANRTGPSAHQEWKARARAAAAAACEVVWAWLEDANVD